MNDIWEDLEKLTTEGGVLYVANVIRTLADAIKKFYDTYDKQPPETDGPITEVTPGEDPEDPEEFETATLFNDGIWIYKVDKEAETAQVIGTVESTYPSLDFKNFVDIIPMYIRYDKTPEKDGVEAVEHVYFRVLEWHDDGSKFGKIVRSVVAPWVEKMYFSNASHPLTFEATSLQAETIYKRMFFSFPGLKTLQFEGTSILNCNSPLIIDFRGLEKVEGEGFSSITGKIDESMILINMTFDTEYEMVDFGSGSDDDPPKVDWQRVDKPFDLKKIGKIVIIDNGGDRHLPTLQNKKLFKVDDAANVEVYASSIYDSFYTDGKQNRDVVDNVFFGDFGASTLPKLKFY